MNPLERRLLEAVSLDAPCVLVEALSRSPRWLPDPVKAGGVTAEHARLRAGYCSATVDSSSCWRWAFPPGFHCR